MRTRRDVRRGGPLIEALAIRTGLQPGDLGTVIRMHGLLYAREFGFDATFEAYVAGPLAAFAERSSPREQIWLAESGSRIVGVVAIVETDDGAAQLRWFLVDPDARGTGLGTALVSHAVAFSRACAYRAIVLWTVSALTVAARIYRAAGFTLVEELSGRHWGVDLIEARYEKRLA